MVSPLDVATPATAFVGDNAYVLGTTRTRSFDVFSEDTNDQLVLENLTGDRIKVFIKENFGDPDIVPMATFDGTLDATAKGRFQLTIPFNCSLPIGKLEYRGLRIVNPDTAQETREPLWTEVFEVKG